MGTLKNQRKWLSLCGGWGQGCAQQHRREAVGKEEKRFPPKKNKSATPLPKSKNLVDLVPPRRDKSRCGIWKSGLLML
jgi:hypothetical protein